MSDDKAHLAAARLGTAQDWAGEKVRVVDLGDWVKAHVPA